MVSRLRAGVSLWLLLAFEAFTRAQDQFEPIFSLEAETIDLRFCGDPSFDSLGVLNSTSQTSNARAEIRTILCQLISKQSQACPMKIVGPNPSRIQPADENVSSHPFEFPAPMRELHTFKHSNNIVVRLADTSLWQSTDEGLTWSQLFLGEQFTGLYHHEFDNDRAYLTTGSNKFYFTTDAGRTWYTLFGPTLPNFFGVPVFQFHPTHSDYLLWAGHKNCEGDRSQCRIEAYYSSNNGRSWNLVDKYVRTCVWGKTSGSDNDPRGVICESFQYKEGDQRAFHVGLHAENPLGLVVGSTFLGHDGNTKKVVDHIIRFAESSGFLVVSKYQEEKELSDLHVSLDGKSFTKALFPPFVDILPSQVGYTILDSGSWSLFVHILTVSDLLGRNFGDIFKSDASGTYFIPSIRNVNSDEVGTVDFERVAGIDGIALANIIMNPEEWPSAGKKLQTRITRNDGGTWRPLNPPSVDSRGEKYECNSINSTCGLHLAGRTAKSTPNSTPLVPGLLVAVGSVGESLGRSYLWDTFLSRDAGETWEEIAKGAHQWAFGDSGSIVVIFSQTEEINHVLYSTNKGISWKEYKFSDEKMWVQSIKVVPEGTGRKFILSGQPPRSPHSHVVLVQLDLSSSIERPCVLDVEDTNNSDFEYWSPTGADHSTAGECILGRRTIYHRQQRESDCIIGIREMEQPRVLENCLCTTADFECEFNHLRNAEGECELIPGAEPLPPDDSCTSGEDYWWDRTPCRKIPSSSCSRGIRLDRGPAHKCDETTSPSNIQLWSFILIPPLIAILTVAAWIYRRLGGLTTGSIRLPEDDQHEQVDEV